jgi:hypothetical protein
MAISVNTIQRRAWAGLLSPLSSSGSRPPEASRALMTKAPAFMSFSTAPSGKTVVAFWPVAPPVTCTVPFQTLRPSSPTASSP